MELGVLIKIAEELNELLIGGFVNKIHQPLPREIVLRIRTKNFGEKKLMISADPLLGRIHITDLKIPNPPKPPNFCAYLRAHFQGSRVVEIKSSQEDRIVEILAVRGPEEARIKRKLILELLGRDSNIILVDCLSNQIMDCLHHIPPKETGTRVVLPGTMYIYPPLRRSEACSIILDRVTPGITKDYAGKKRLTLSATAPDDEIFPTMNSAAEAYYRPKLRSVILEAFRREIASPVRSRIKSLERRTIKVREDIRKLESYIDRLLDAELIKANLHKIKKGMSTIELYDWEGNPRVIELEPSLDPISNMNLLFKKSARGKRGLMKAQERLSTTLEEKNALEDLLFLIHDAKDVSDLEKLAEEISSLSPKNEPKTRRPFEPKSHSALTDEIVTPSGLKIIIGKSARGNDFLLRNKARKEDLWFHVKDMPGAHVLLLCGPNRSPGERDIELAASIAVYFSKARGKGKTEVMLATVRHIGRQKGVVPGQVTVRKYKTIMSEGIEDSQIETMLIPKS